MTALDSMLPEEPLWFLTHLCLELLHWQAMHFVIFWMNCNYDIKVLQNEHSISKVSTKKCEGFQLRTGQMSENWETGIFFNDNIYKAGLKIGQFSLSHSEIWLVPEWQLGGLAALSSLQKLIRKVSYFMLIHMLHHIWRNTLTMLAWSRGHIIVFLSNIKLNSASVMLQPNNEIHATFVLKPSITKAFAWMLNLCSESIACCTTRTDGLSALSPTVKWKFIGSSTFFHRYCH